MNNTEYKNAYKNIKVTKSFQNRVFAQLSEDKQIKRQPAGLAWKIAVIAACAMFIVFSLAMLLNTPKDNEENLAAVTPIQSEYNTTSPSEYELPTAYTNGYQLCSVAYQLDDWIYVGVVNGIYKSDGKETVKICNDQASNIYVFDDWIYYLCSTWTDPNGNTAKDDYKLVKIRTDGKERTVLSEDIFPVDMQVVGDWIYYIDVSTSIEKDSKIGLYRIRTDGTEKTCLIEGAEEIYFSDDCIYYIYHPDLTDPSVLSTKCKLVKIQLDGLENTLICDIEGNASNLTLDGDYIYYRNTTTLYYSQSEIDEYNNRLKNLDLQGLQDLRNSNDASQLSRTQSEFDEYLNNNIKYLDGLIDISDFTELTRSYMSINSNTVKSYSSTVCRVKKDGTDKKSIIIDVEIDIDRFFVIDNWIYYDNYKKYADAVENEDGGYIDDGIIALINSDGAFYLDGLYKVYFDGTQKQKIFDGQGRYPIDRVAGNYAYFYKRNSQPDSWELASLWKVRLDGTSEQKVFSYDIFTDKG